MLKKVMRWVPVTCIILFILMFVGMIKADCYTEGVNNYCNSALWTANSYSFGMADILAMFGHANALHLLGNTLTLFVFAIPAELILGRRKFIAGVLFAMLVHVISSEMLHSNGLGASGWLMAMPGLMFGASMWKIWKEGEESACMSIPTFLFGTSIIMVAMDVASLGTKSGIDHMAHISGFVSGLVFVFAGLPFLAMTIRDEYRAWKRQRAWHKKRALARV